MSFQARVISSLLGLVGGLLGGTLGYYAFVWAVGQGFYAMIAPGGLLGIGCGLAAQHPSRIRGVVCAITALGLGLFSEWKVFPWVADDSFLYFAKNIPNLKMITDLMIILGAIVAYWGGKEGNLAGWYGSRKPSPRGGDS